MFESNRRTFLQTTAAAILASPAITLADNSGRSPIKVGQIGTRHAHAGGKMETFRKFPDLFEVVGVVEKDPQQRKRMESSEVYRGLTWMSEEELLSIPDVLGIAVETEIEDLLPVAEKCIQTGKHIHLDKPAGTSLEHFRRICRAADEKQLMIQMGYMYRSNPAFQFLFKAVRAGWLGEVHQVHCEMSKKVNDATRKDLAQFPGGSMFELGCHLIDAVVAVMGPPDKVTAFNRNTRPEQDSLMDNCLAVFEYPKATATIRSTVVEVDGGRRRQFIACGSKGTIKIEPLEPHQLLLTLESETEGFKKGTHQIDLPKSTGRYDGDFQHFAAVIRGEEPVLYTTKHDLAVQEALLKASEMPLM
ncbi:Gfo/Idh/MocA family oxidoreductase [Rubinisphaera sp.]|uniref:Gfo/Idh/MocA family protein n=1 Tax=Rubinisphaera sp. TaxID=2024857 RepID=UPI000C0E2059|nr:Gfo/Idh/MocA family oxidoreductase [Rubinisphaera sp.]MBV08499.1 dehydrogenase [Rubinisphaera sp.]HCS50629.1 gfo/Idh/MocA family oxidoreductase [Planctomycetaceae bacterium]|tara:strand:+ start:904 stop:1983 length:1080 start_codon:yes stop_codon:yes gene_type:complete